MAFEEISNAQIINDCFLLIVKVVEKLWLELFEIILFICLPTFLGLYYFLGKKTNQKEKCEFELKQDKENFTHKRVLIFHIVYKIYLQPQYADSHFILGNSLFGDAKLTKSSDPNENPYSGYGIEFDGGWFFSMTDRSEIGKNAIFFGADMSSYLHIGQKNIT